MDATTVTLICVLMGLAAALHPTAGHDVASAFFAALWFFAGTLETMRPAALVLDLILACNKLISS